MCSILVSEFSHSYSSKKDIFHSILFTTLGVSIYNTFKINAFPQPNSWIQYPYIKSSKFWWYFMNKQSRYTIPYFPTVGVFWEKLTNTISWKTFLYQSLKLKINNKIKLFSLFEILVRFHNQTKNIFPLLFFPTIFFWRKSTQHQIFKTGFFQQSKI